MLKGHKFIGGITIKCLVCGKLVSGVTKARKFCSTRCTKKNSYIAHPRKSSEWRKCSYCSKPVKVMPYRLHFKHFFCNRSHQILFLKKNSFSLFCVICGKKFYCQPCQVKYRNRQTCSMACKSKLQWLKAEERHKSGVYTKHQIERCLRYSKKANDWRMSIFRRDNYTCQECKVRGGYLEAHHIKPFAYFPELRYELANGITLCRKCHAKTKIGYKKLRGVYGKKVS